MRSVRVPALILLLCSPCVCGAARSASTDQPVAVKLEPAQPTAVALPEPVASVSAGVAPERFSLDYDGPYLFLLPLDPTVAGRLFVVGQSGKLYTITFKVATPADDVVHLTAPASTPAVTPQPFTVASFLRVLRTGTALPGQQVSDGPLPAPNDPRIRLTDATTIARGAMRGLVVTVRNTQTVPLALDIRVGETRGGPAEDVVALSTWTWPPRLTIKAVAAEAEMLGPAGQTRLYVVFEQRR